jgi:hypothetical protein
MSWKPRPQGLGFLFHALGRERFDLGQIVNDASIIPDHRLRAAQLT